MPQKRKPRPHHTGDLGPPPVDPREPDPTWGDEGGGGEYEGGPVTHREPETPPGDGKRRGR